MELTTNAAVGAALLSAIEAHNLKKVRAICRAVEETRRRQWHVASLRSQGGSGDPQGPGLVSLDALVTPAGVTGFHLACKAWSVHRDWPVSEKRFDRMALALLEAGASPFAEFGPPGAKRTIFEELGRGVMPPSVAKWMAKQRFDEVCSFAEVVVTKKSHLCKPLSRAMG